MIDYEAERKIRQNNFMQSVFNGMNAIEKHLNTPNPYGQGNNYHNQLKQRANTEVKAPTYNIGGNTYQGRATQPIVRNEGSFWDRLYSLTNSAIKRQDDQFNANLQNSLIKENEMAKREQANKNRDFRYGVAKDNMDRQVDVMDVNRKYYNDLEKQKIQRAGQDIGSVVPNYSDLSDDGKVLAQSKYINRGLIPNGITGENKTFGRNRTIPAYDTNATQTGFNFQSPESYNLDYNDYFGDDSFWGDNSINDDLVTIEDENGRKLRVTREEAKRLMGE